MIEKIMLGATTVAAAAVIVGIVVNSTPLATGGALAVIALALGSLIMDLA